jgi:hypothetical protein
MPEPKTEKPIDLGVYSKRGANTARISTTEIIAIGLSLVWLALVGGFFMFAGNGDGAAEVNSLQFVMTVLAIFLPIAMIWIATTAARSTRVMRDEFARLQTAMDAMRHAYVIQQQTSGMNVKPSVEKKLDEIVAAQRQTETAIATFTSSREAGGVLNSAIKAAVAKTAGLTPGSGGGEQGNLALGTPSEALADPISVADFVRALNFPETADDEEGFRALRRALKDRGVAKLIQAAQDVLTLLSQDGIYMDDMRPDRARPEIWRNFAKGERGRTVAALGGVRDRSSLALTAGRMRKDPIFRDAAHHFLRQFDKTFSEFEANASDTEIASLSDTRTARAFMLLGRVTGTFD